jgi:hypothetical protein
MSTDRGIDREIQPLQARVRMPFRIAAWIVGVAAVLTSVALLAALILEDPAESSAGDSSDLFRVSLLSLGMGILFIVAGYTGKDPFVGLLADRPPKRNQEPDEPGGA